MCVTWINVLCGNKTFNFWLWNSIFRNDCKLNLRSGDDSLPKDYQNNLSLLIKYRAVNSFHAETNTDSHTEIYRHTSLFQLVYREKSNTCVMIHNKNKIHKCADNLRTVTNTLHFLIHDKRASEFFHHQLTITDPDSQQLLKNSPLNIKCQQQPQINVCNVWINVTSSRQ